MKRGPQYALAALATATFTLLATGALLYIAQQPSAAGGRIMAGLSVRLYGAKGDGKADDTRAFVMALQAAARSHRRVLVPAGVYRLRRLSVPDGVRLKGAGRSTTWLKGRLDFGSNQTISDLKIGDSGNSAVHNQAGANHTTFQRCRFHGGGGETGWIGSPVIALGMNGNVSNITFKDSDVERNLGSDPSFNNGYNDITIYEARGAHVSDITFDGVHVGVSNGVKTGSPRMGLEAWTAKLSENGSGIGWRNITIRNSVFEPTDAQSLDFADADDGRADGVLVEGSTLKGGGVTQVKWGYTICIEAPTGVVIRNNTIYHGSEQTLMFANMHSTGPGATITGNNFDVMYSNGVPVSTSYPFSIWGQYNVFTGNTISYSSNSVSRVVELVNAVHNTVTGNTFHLDDETAVWENFGSSGNTLAPNTVD